MFVALFTVVLVGLGAFAIDVSRLYVGVNELQAAADATALRGALHIQRLPGTNASDSMTAFAATNEAFGAPAAIAASDIESGLWNPNTKTFTAYPWTDARVNSVRVAARQSTGLLLASTLNRLTDAPERRSIAWVANLTGTDGIKPWGIVRAVVETKAGSISRHKRGSTHSSRNS